MPVFARRPLASSTSPRGLELDWIIPNDVICSDWLFSLFGCIIILHICPLLVHKKFQDEEKNSTQKKKQKTGATSKMS